VYVHEKILPSLNDMPDKKTTIKDIAHMANVSIGTVDRVIHNRGEVNEETRKRILSIVDNLGYTPNLLAKSLALKKQFRICALVPASDNTNPYWTKPLSGLERASEEIKKFNVVCDIYTYAIDSVSDFEKKFRKIISAEPDGIVFTPHFTEISQKMVELCSEKAIPVIYLDSNIETTNVLGYYGQDATSSGNLAAHLMSYGLDKNTTVLILKLAKNKATFSHLMKREQGFLNFLNENQNLAIHSISLEIDFSDDKKTTEAILNLIRETPSLKGIFVTNSRVHKVAKVLKDNKLTNLLLVGYDLTDENIYFLKQGVINFLIAQKPEEQGYKSIMALFNHIHKIGTNERVNYSPIDIIMKENLVFYNNI
jgi:LacI family transcriptional regulator